MAGIKHIQVSPRIAGGTVVPSDLSGIFRPVENPIDYDAYFDGSNHPLSEGYSTDSAAQAAYPNLSAYLSDNSLPALTLADTIDYAAIGEAGWSLPAKGGTVVLPPGVAKISRPLVFGNGSRTEGSSRNGIQIMGQGIGGIYEPGGSPFIYEHPSRACVISPISSISGPVLTFRGRMYGAGLHNVTLDATTGYLAPCCLQVYHVINSHFSYIQCRNASQWGVRAEIDNTRTYDYWSCDNFWNKISIQARSSSNGFMLGDASAPYGQLGDLCRHYIYGLDISGTNGTQIALQIGMCDSMWLQHVSIYGFAAAKQLVIKPQAADAHYPENITISDLMCGGGMDNNTADPDNFWTIDESLATWLAGDNKITLPFLHQESGNPAFPSDLRFTGFNKAGAFYNGWGSGGSSGITRVHYDLTAPFTVPAPSVSTDLYIVSLKQDATGGRTVAWNAVYKFTENFRPDYRANRRSIYTFVKVGSEYHLISPIVGVL